MTFWQTLTMNTLFGCMAFGLSIQSGMAKDSASPDPASREATTRPDPQQVCKLDRTVRVELDYLLYLPKEYEQKPAWPLLLFLHGAGERGKNLDLVKTHGPPKMIAAARNFPSSWYRPSAVTTAGGKRSNWRPCWMKSRRNIMSTKTGST